MKLKKVLALTLAGIMTVGLAACGGTKESSEKTEAGKEKQKLVIWSWGADEEKKSREAAVEAFQKAHPEIEVEHSVIPTADHVWDQKMTYYRPDGKLEGMPLLQNCFVLAYNKDMFDEFGVEYPTAEWTWDDVAEAAKKFAGGEGADATFGIVNHWIDPPLSIICKGGNAYSDDLSTCEIDSQEVRDGLDLFGDMIQSGAMPDDTAAKSLPKEQLFVSGHAAMYTLGGFETKLIAEEIGENFNWDVVSMPKVPDGGKNNLLYATGYAMLKDSENKDAAWTFLKEASYENEDMAKETCRAGMTACKSVAEGYYKELTYGPIDNSAYLEGLSDAKLNIWGGAYAAPGDVWTQIWQAVTIDGKSADEAINEYYPALEKAFNEANGN